MYAAVLSRCFLKEAENYKAIKWFKNKRKNTNRKKETPAEIGSRLMKRYRDFQMNEPPTNP